MLSSISPYKKHLTETNRLQELSVINNFISFYKQRDLDYTNLTAENFILYRNSELSKLTHGIANTYIRYIKKFYQYLINLNLCEGKIYFNLREGLKTFQYTKKFEYFTEEQLIKLLSTTADLIPRYPADRTKITLLLMFYSGLSEKEMLLLKKEHFDFNRNIIKLNEKRITFFPKELNPLIQDYFKTYPALENAFDLTPKAIPEMIKYLHEFNPRSKSKIRIPLFKSSLAVFLINQGLDTRVISLLLGVTAQTLEDYYKFLPIDIHGANKIYRQAIKPNLELL